MSFLIENCENIMGFLGEEWAKELFQEPIIATFESGSKICSGRFL